MIDLRPQLLKISPPVEGCVIEIKRFLRPLVKIIRGTDRRSLDPPQTQVLDARSLEFVSNYLESNPVRKLHLGAGYHELQQWLNTDLNPRSPNIIRMDVAKSFPFSDSIFDKVYCEHMIEHVPYVGAQQMIHECFRVLKPRGRIRIATPSLKKIIKLWTGPHTDVETRYIGWATQQSISWAPKADPVFVVNNFVRDWGHQFIYDENALVGLLECVGFTNFSWHQLSQSTDPHFRNLENVVRMPVEFLDLETMIIEAEKPDHSLSH